MLILRASFHMLLSGWIDSVTFWSPWNELSRDVYSGIAYTSCPSATHENHSEMHLADGFVIVDGSKNMAAMEFECKYWEKHFWKLTWKPTKWRYGRWFVLFPSVMFRFHVSSPGCIYIQLQYHALSHWVTVFSVTPVYTFLWKMTWYEHTNIDI